MANNKREIVKIPDNLEFSIDSFITPGCYEGDLSSIVIPEGLVVDRVKKLAHELHDSLGDVPLILLCILKGSYKFFTTLVDELTIARQNCSTSLTVEFIRAKSYEGTESTGHLQIIGLESIEELRGKNIVIVEDIVDSGLTLHRLIKTVKDHGAENIWTAILLSKRVTRTKEVPENFVAFSIPDKFIVGYGLDYNQKFRDLNHIAAMSVVGIEKYK
uniref:Hypoxanthine phosphoribosyltransferase n=1 Tax=Parastrongyloides trichosuri TaxID=131310 RepID=A0A0N4ZXY4_PARTI